MSGGVKNTRSALLYFYSKHYVPSKMAAVVVGPQSLDELEAIAVSKLSLIPSDRPTPPGTSSSIIALVDEAASLVPPLTPQSSSQSSPTFSPSWTTPFPNLLTTLPLRSMRKLYLSFPLPPQRHKKDRSPTHLLGHLLGHEGKGSAFAVLQDASLITGLSAGARMEDSSQLLFQVEVALTEEGEDRWKDVVQIIFDQISHIRRLCEHPTADDRHDLETRWSEVAKINAMHFSQNSPSHPYSFAPSMAQR